MPPARTRAPRATASLTCSSILAIAFALIIGPICDFESLAGPTTKAETRTLSFSRKLPYTFDCTYTRFGHTQVWPPLRNFATIKPSTAASMSASSNTMKGALPPSSNASFFKVREDSWARCLPTGVEPVKVILRTRGSSNQTSATIFEAEVLTMFNTPAGTPASSASLTSAKAVSGVSAAGLQTTVQPAARAGAIFRAIIAAGKFQGVIAATTPTGSLYAAILRPRTA
ncbi:hypothetical protein D3C81_1414560 [compost metagenome]